MFGSGFADAGGGGTCLYDFAFAHYLVMEMGHARKSLVQRLSHAIRQIISANLFFT